MFSQKDVIQSSDVVNLLGISTRQGRELLNTWVNQGWLVVLDPSRRGREYGLDEEYKQLI